MNTQDLMTPLERSKALSAGAAIDRLPCIPIVGNSAARLINARVSEFRGNGKLIAEAHIAAYRTFGYDNIRIFTDLYQQAEAMGAEVFYPEDETAYLKTPALQKIKSVSDIVPADPWHDGNLPEFLEAIKITVDRVGNEVPVTGAVVGPFTNTSFLLGAEELARKITREPQTVHALCEISLETAIRYCRAIISVGGTPSITDAMSSSSVISPHHFEIFSFPYLKRLIEDIHQMDKKVTLHICGKTKSILSRMADTGADCLSIDTDLSIAEAKQLVGHRIKIMGNVNPTEIMLNGSSSMIRKAVINCVRDGFDSPCGYIVASGCSLPTATPAENIHAMMNIVRKIGYPVTIDKLERLYIS